MVKGLGYIEATSNGEEEGAVTLWVENSLGMLKIPSSILNLKVLLWKVVRKTIA